MTEPSPFIDTVDQLNALVRNGRVRRPRALVVLRDPRHDCPEGAEQVVVRVDTVTEFEAWCVALGATEVPSDDHGREHRCADCVRFPMFVTVQWSATALWNGVS